MALARVATLMRAGGWFWGASLILIAGGGASLSRGRQKVQMNANARTGLLNAQSLWVWRRFFVG